MPEAAWRCSECGTINEPVANSCRTCGKWPSLFDLQDSVVEEPVEVGAVREQAEPALEIGEQRYEHYEPEPEVALPEDAEGEVVARRRNVVSYLVPLAFVVYLVLSIVFADR